VDASSDRGDRALTVVLALEEGERTRIFVGPGSASGSDAPGAAAVRVWASAEAVA
jgi:hypothetical protein